MQIHLFGASTPTGEAFKDLLVSKSPSVSLVSYSRSNPSFLWADFSDPYSFRPGGVVGCPSVWISFGPIWLLAPFLEELSRSYPERLQGLRSVIACSSSSAITKRFAANPFDRELVAKLINAEDHLIRVCQHLELPCRILRPTLIYGRIGPYLDHNLNLLIKMMRRLPFLPLPAHTGLRQPIHASQLAAVALALAEQCAMGDFDPQLPERIALGGDSEISYSAMLRNLQQSLPFNDPARRCCLLSIPTRLFQAAAAPLLLNSPKKFEAVLRISADLSGFTPAHKLLGSEPQDFPVSPFI